ncbi:unnamed protein product, partial [Ixodes persulcatus]
ARLTIVQKQKDFPMLLLHVLIESLQPEAEKAERFMLSLDQLQKENIGNGVLVPSTLLATLNKNYASQPNKLARHLVRIVFTAEERRGKPLNGKAEMLGRTSPPRSALIKKRWMPSSPTSAANASLTTPRSRTASATCYQRNRKNRHILELIKFKRVSNGTISIISNS